MAAVQAALESWQNALRLAAAGGEAVQDDLACLEKACGALQGEGPLDRELAEHLRQYPGAADAIPDRWLQAVARRLLADDNFGDARIILTLLRERQDAATPEIGRAHV